MSEIEGFPVVGHGRFYSLGMGKDTYAAKAYEEHSPAMLRLSMLAELNQNVIDHVVERVYKDQKYDALEDYWLKIHERLTITTDNSARTLSVSDNKAAVMVREAIVMEKKHICLYTFQYGIGMLPASLLQIGNTTKGVRCGLPLAGGHGVGLKQVLLTFSMRGWKYVVRGVLPVDESKVCEWKTQKPASAHDVFGVRGMISPRDSFLWPEAVKSFVPATGLYLCNIFKFPIPSFMDLHLWFCPPYPGSVHVRAWAPPMKRTVLALFGVLAVKTNTVGMHSCFSALHAFNSSCARQYVAGDQDHGLYLTARAKEAVSFERAVRRLARFAHLVWTEASDLCLSSRHGVSQCAAVCVRRLHQRCAYQFQRVAYGQAALSVAARPKRRLATLECTLLARARAAEVDRHVGGQEHSRVHSLGAWRRNVVCVAQDLPGVG